MSGRGVAGGGRHVDVVGARQLRCVGDVRQLALASLLVLSPWLSRSIEASPTEVVLDP